MLLTSEYGITWCTADERAYCWGQMPSVMETNAFIDSDECVLCWRRTHFTLQTNVLGTRVRISGNTHTASYQTEVMWRWLLYSHSYSPLKRALASYITSRRSKGFDANCTSTPCLYNTWSGAKHDCLIQVSLYRKIIALQTTGVGWKGNDVT